jgi:hypothetical protein
MAPRTKSHLKITTLDAAALQALVEQPQVEVEEPFAPPAAPSASISYFVDIPDLPPDARGSSPGFDLLDGWMEDQSDEMEIQQQANATLENLISWLLPPEAPPVVTLHPPVPDPSRNDFESDEPDFPHLNLGSLSVCGFTMERLELHHRSLTTDHSFSKKISQIYSPKTQFTIQAPIYSSRIITFGAYTFVMWFRDPHNAQTQIANAAMDPSLCSCDARTVLGIGSPVPNAPSTIIADFRSTGLKLSSPRSLEHPLVLAIGGQFHSKSLEDIFT